MFNSCTFNTSKFNSSCLREIIIPEVEGGGFNLIGFVLLANELNISLTAKTLSQIQQNFVLNGTKLISFNIQADLRGFKKYLTEQEIDVASFKLVLAQQLQELKGTRLLKGTENVSIQGQKQILNRQENIIKGTKDIRNILAVLDLLDLD